MSQDSHGDPQIELWYGIVCALMAALFAALIVYLIV